MKVRRAVPGLIFGSAVAYLLALGWAMQRLSYDIWGAMIMGPLVAAIGIPLVVTVFRHDDPVILRLALFGLAAKFVGCIARYWVVFSAYDGAADAGRYHDFARRTAQAIRGGEIAAITILPTGVGTQFIERLTTTMYTFFGSSRLAGFFLFGFMAYCGAVLFVKAGALAIPPLSMRRYASMVFFLPSIVFWPSSIGKEAWMMLVLGLASYGGASLYAGRPAVRSLVVTALGLGGAALVRPHMAGIWLAALTLGLFVAAFGKRAGRVRRSRFGSLVLLMVAGIALTFVAGFALRYLEPPGEDDGSTSTVTRVFEETERRSEIGNSGFDTIDVSSPARWPYAIVRTLTRPLLNEAVSLTTLLPAAETTALLLIGAWGWRRWWNLPGMMRRYAYVTYAIAAALMFGLAFTTIGNLGILTRQRSLVMPLLSLLWCVPPREPATSERYKHRLEMHTPTLTG